MSDNQNEYYDYNINYDTDTETQTQTQTDFSVSDIIGMSFNLNGLNKINVTPAKTNIKSIVVSCSKFVLNVKCTICQKTVDQIMKQLDCKTIELHRSDTLCDDFTLAFTRWDFVSPTNKSVTVSDMPKLLEALDIGSILYCDDCHYNKFVKRCGVCNWAYDAIHFTTLPYYNYETKREGDVCNNCINAYQTTHCSTCKTYVDNESITTLSGIVVCAGCNNKFYAKCTCRECGINAYSVKAKQDLHFYSNAGLITLRLNKNGLIYTTTPIKTIQQSDMFTCTKCVKIIPFMKVCSFCKYYKRSEETNVRTCFSNGMLCVYNICVSCTHSPKIQKCTTCEGYMSIHMDSKFICTDCTYEPPRLIF